MSALVSVQDFENYAYQTLPRLALDYYRSGAGQQYTLENNKKAFSKLRIRPRCLRDVSNRNLSVKILNNNINMPVGIAPTAMQKMAHPEGECANAKAAERAGTIFIASTISTSSIEDIANAAPKAVKWYQLYIYQDRKVTLDLISRAEKAGFSALVLTVDTPFFGLRLADMRNKFSLPPHLKFANFQGEKATKINVKGEGSGLNNYVQGLFDPSLTWKDVTWLQSVTRLPIILKGILTVEDAIIASKLKISGIIVSNHGARQIDGTPATIECLSEIVKAVGNDVDVYLDGGIRDGTDIFKALALGAKMVFVGRPALWGLVHSGTEGVLKILNILRVELDYAMAMAGCSTIQDITQNMIVHKNYYSNL